MPKLIIGTRGSALALAQAYEVRFRLMQLHKGYSGEEDISLDPIRTSGDEITSRSLAEIGGKGLFTKEIDEALLDGRVDIAVHSMKDIPAVIPSGIAITCIPKREEANDAFISRRWRSLASLPRGAKVGTSSLRRKTQLLRARPDLEIVDFRGNVDTRLRKLEDDKSMDATVLAVCGLKRMRKTEAITERLTTETMLPAVGQGAIAIMCRSDDEESKRLLAPMHDENTALEIAAERALLAMLGGNCTTPIAALARMKENLLLLQSRLLSHDGREMIELSDVAPAEDAVDLGQRMGEKLLSIAPKYLLPK